MKVYFAGAGPGAPDLMTVRAARLLSRAAMVLLADSLVNRKLLEGCRPDAQIFDASQLDADQQEACYLLAREHGCDVVRLHSGDPSLFGAAAETMRQLDRLGIDYEWVPGVSSFTAAAATLSVELTIPGISQTVILARSSGPDPAPDTGSGQGAIPVLENLGSLAAHQATLAVFLSGPHLESVVSELARHYPPETPVALVRKASWPEEKTWKGTLAAAAVLARSDTRQWALSTMMLIGRALRG